MKTYRTIDLLNKVYNGEKIGNKLQNVKTGQIIHQGEDSHSSRNFFNKWGINIMPEINNPLDLENWLKEEWKEAPKTATFQEAMNSNKCVRPDNPKYTEHKKMTYWICRFPNITVDELRELINGKWFIEGGY